MNQRHPFAGLIGLVLIGFAFVAYLIDVAEAGVRWFFVARRARRSSLVWKREGDLFSMTAQRGEHRAVSDIPVGGFCRWDRVPDDRPNFGGSIVFMLGDDERPFATQWFDDNRLIRRFIDDLIGAGVVIGPPVVIDRVPDRFVWPPKFASRRETMLVCALLVPMIIWRWIMYFLGIGA